MSNPQPEVEQFDCIIVGSGQAGSPLASSFAEAGKRTVLIERAHIGGCCLNEGCTPTKTLVASAEVAYLARRASDFGVHVGDVQVNMVEVRQRKRNMVDSFASESVQSLKEQKGLDLVFGAARFSDPKTMTVLTADGSHRLLSAPTIVLNVGARPTVPKIDGLDSVAYLDSTSVMELDVVPEHLIVLGGGYIAVEFAQMFRRFGAAVTIIQADGQILGNEDKDVAEGAQDILRGDGIEILLNSHATAVKLDGESGGVSVTVESDGTQSRVIGSHLLVAVGRTPNSDSLDLDKAGVPTDDKGHIQVDDWLHTGVPGVYAVGDVTGGPQFTHISYDDYRILEANILKGGDRSRAGRMVPYTVFMDPQLGRVGLSEHEATKAGIDYKIAKIAMNEVARPLEAGRDQGFMKAIVDSKTELILGFACLGFNGGELMGAVQMAMLGKLSYKALRNGVFAHPTLVESLNNLFMTLD